MAAKNPRIHASAQWRVQRLARATTLLDMVLPARYLRGIAGVRRLAAFSQGYYALLKK